MINKIYFNGLLNNEELEVIKATLGLKITSIQFEGANISNSKKMKISTFNSFAVSFSQGNSMLHLIFKFRCIKPSDLIWEQCGIKIQVIKEEHKPLREKILFPPHSLDSSFNVSIDDFDNLSTIVSFSIYGNSMEGNISKCIPSLTKNDFTDSGISPDTFIEVNSIELIEVLLENNMKIFIIVREQGFEIELNTSNTLEEIKEEYFDDRYDLKLQHSIQQI